MININEYLLSKRNTNIVSFPSQPSNEVIEYLEKFGFVEIDTSEDILDQRSMLYDATKDKNYKDAYGFFTAPDLNTALPWVMFCRNNPITEEHPIVFMHLGGKYKGDEIGYIDYKEGRHWVDFRNRLSFTDYDELVRYIEKHILY